MFCRNIFSHSYCSAYISQKFLKKSLFFFRVFFMAFYLWNLTFLFSILWERCSNAWNEDIFIFFSFSYRNVSCKSKLNLHRKYTYSFVFFNHWLYLFLKLNLKWRRKYVRPALHGRWICHAHQIQTMIWNFQILLFFYRVIYKNGSSTKSHDQT